MKSAIILVLICTRIFLSAQGISTPTMIPQAPTSSSFVKIATSLTLSSIQGEIGSPTFTVSNSPNKILMEVCYSVDVWFGNNYRVDTFNVGLLAAGIYTVTFRAHFSSDQNTCNNVFQDSITYTIVVDDPTAIDEQSVDDQVSIFPNPIKDNFNIFTSNGQIQNLNFTIINTLGQTVYPSTNFSSDQTLTLAGFQPGFYFVDIRSGASNKTFKIIKD